MPRSPPQPAQTHRTTRSTAVVLVCSVDDTARPCLPHAEVHQDGRVGRKPGGPIRRRRGTLRGALLPPGSHRAGDARSCARQVCRNILCHNDVATTTPWTAQQMGFNPCAAATRPVGRIESFTDHAFVLMFCGDLVHVAAGAVDAAAESPVAPALAVRPPTGDRGR
jgi:hypothetical protein